MILFKKILASLLVSAIALFGFNGLTAEDAAADEPAQTHDSSAAKSEHKGKKGKKKKSKKKHHKKAKKGAKKGKEEGTKSETTPPAHSETEPAGEEQ